MPFFCFFFSFLSFIPLIYCLSSLNFLHSSILKFRHWQYYIFLRAWLSVERHVFCSGRFLEGKIFPLNIHRNLRDWTLSLWIVEKRKQKSLHWVWPEIIWDAYYYSLDFTGRSTGTEYRGAQLLGCLRFFL